MEEKFLHYTWKYKLFNQANLFTTAGEPIEIIKFGEHNHQSGPDFFNARVKIGDTDWTGNLEIHVNSSHWNAHNHQFDPAYDNVVLHVVYEYDYAVKNTLGKTIPTLELRGRIPLENLTRYEQLKVNDKGIACSKQIASVPSHILNPWLERLLAERLESKTLVLHDIFRETANDWEETFYRALAKNFGFKVNAFPFYLLAKNLPLKILLKHADDALQTEALLFGQAGFLNEQFSDKYFQKLQNEYEFLRNKYSLVSLQKPMWKMGRMRPVNLPTIRIAQFASLVKKMNGLFSRLLEQADIEYFYAIFESEPAGYWSEHYSFGKISHKRSKQIGKEAVENIIINTVVPLVFLFGKTTDNEKYFELCFNLLEKIKPEQNKIISEFEKYGLKTLNAAQGQALLQQKTNYCEKKACLNCRIGYHVLNS